MNIRLSNKTKIQIKQSSDIYSVMRGILLREEKIDRDREHFWTISLNNANKILNIELVSMGTVNRTLAEPMEIFSVPLQKRAVKLVLVHNHPSGTLRPSEEDKDLTDLLIQVGNIMHVPVLDHLIITEHSYYSFVDSGLLKELSKSIKYLPPYKIKERYSKEAKEKGEKIGARKKAKEMARIMKQKGMDVAIIAEVSGLSKTVINKLKIESE